MQEHYSHLTAVRILCFDSLDNEDISHCMVNVDTDKLGKMSYGCQDVFCSNYIWFDM